MRTTIIPYNPRLKERARNLRKNMTLAEVLLWKQLRRGQRSGFDFDRQRSIDEYIVDFFCKNLCLAIEVDGRTHDFKQTEDAVRQRRLESLGVRFLRFWDCEVKDDLTGVVRRIDEWIADHSNGTQPTPAYGHPSKGGDS